VLNHQGVIFNKISNGELKKHSLIISARNVPSLKKSRLIIIDEEEISEIHNALVGQTVLSDEEMIQSSISTLESNILNKIARKYEEEKLPFIRKWYWPNFKKICYIVTHDIDEIDIYPGTKDKIELIKYLLHRLILKNYGDNIEKILSLEDEKKITSTFFFLSNYKRKLQRYMEFRKNHVHLMKRVSERKREISLHGSGDAATDESTMRREKDELERITGEKITGYRQHLLNYRFKLPESIDQLQKLAFSYDLSISDNDRSGFMKGICHPYHPLMSEGRANLVEIPVPYEDWTSLSKKLTYQSQIAVIDVLLETTRRFNGCIAFGIHNNYVNESRYKELYDAFIYILNSCEDDCWTTTSKSCAEWWRMREDAKIQVSLEGDEVTYSSDTELPIEITNDGKKTYMMLRDAKFTL
jgi:signal peptidase I